MINSLVAIYHSRVSYPGYAPPSDPPANGAPADGFASAELDSEERGVHYDSPREVPISKGGEVEDEAVNHNN
jgi:hypothetical protein